MAYSMLVGSVASQLINASPNKKLLEYSYRQQLMDILPSLALSAVMFFAVWSVQLLKLGVVPTLLLQIPLGVVIYLSGSALFKMEGFNYVLQIARKFLNRNKAQN